MRTLSLLVLLAVASPLRAQGGAGTDNCNIGAAFECDMYVQRSGPDSAERRVAKVIAVWRGSRVQAPATLDTARSRANSIEYRRRVRAAEDAERIFMGGSAGDSMWEVTVSNQPHRAGRRFGAPDSAFVEGRAFRVPAGDTALVLLISGPITVNSPPPAVTMLMTDGVLPPSRARTWRNGDTTFILRPLRNAPNLPIGFSEIPAVAAFLRGMP